MKIWIMKKQPRVTSNTRDKTEKDLLPMQNNQFYEGSIQQL